MFANDQHLSLAICPRAKWYDWSEHYLCLSLLLTLSCLSYLVSVFLAIYTFSCLLLSKLVFISLSRIELYYCFFSSIIFASFPQETPIIICSKNNLAVFWEASLNRSTKFHVQSQLYRMTHCWSKSSKQFSSMSTTFDCRPSSLTSLAAKRVHDGDHNNAKRRRRTIVAADAGKVCAWRAEDIAVPVSWSHHSAGRCSICDRIQLNSTLGFSVHNARILRCHHGQTTSYR